MILQPIEHKANQLFHINTSLNRIFTTRIKEFTAADPPIQTSKVTVFPFTKYHTRTNNSKLSFVRLFSLPDRMYLFGYQLRNPIRGVRSRKCVFCFQIFSCTIRSYGAGKNDFLYPEFLRKSAYILRTTNICLKISLIRMSRGTMNGCKVKDNVF